MKVSSSFTNQFYSQTDVILSHFYFFSFSTYLSSLFIFSPLYLSSSLHGPIIITIIITYCFAITIIIEMPIRISINMLYECIIAQGLHFIRKWYIFNSQQDWELVLPRNQKRKWFKTYLKNIQKIKIQNYTINQQYIFLSSLYIILKYLYINM